MSNFYVSVRTVGKDVCSVSFVSQYIKLLGTKSSLIIVRNGQAVYVLR